MGQVLFAKIKKRPNRPNPLGISWSLVHLHGICSPPLVQDRSHSPGSGCVGVLLLRPCQARWGPAPVAFATCAWAEGDFKSCDFWMVCVVGDQGSLVMCSVALFHGNDNISDSDAAERSPFQQQCLLPYLDLVGLLYASKLFHNLIKSSTAQANLGEGVSRVIKSSICIDKDRLRRNAYKVTIQEKGGGGGTLS